MASTGINDGRLTSVYVGGTLVANGTTQGLSISSAMIETTNKDSANDASFIPSVRNRTLSGNYMFDEAAAYGFVDLYDLQVAGTSMTVLMSSGVTGDVTYSATAYITSLNNTAGNAEAQTFDVEWQVTGAITKGTVV